MGKIKLNGEVIEDRRQNGARIKLDVGDWIKIFVTIGTTFFIIISGWTTLRITAEQQAVLVAQNVKDIAEVSSIGRDNKKDIEFLKQAFEKIDLKLDKLLKIR